jgi:hypothetical protein
MTAIRPAMSLPSPSPEALRLGVLYKVAQVSSGATVKVKDFHTNEVVGQLMYTRYAPQRVAVLEATKHRVDVVA